MGVNLSYEVCCHFFGKDLSKNIKSISTNVTREYVLKELAIAVLSHSIISFTLVQNALNDLKS
jgi:hypothetical protein